MINKRKVFIHNKFDIIVQDATTGEVKQTARAHNVILQNFFSAVLGPYGWPGTTYIALGSGTGTPAITDSGLFAQWAFIGATTVNQVYAYPASYLKRKVVLQPADYVGKVLTEVGFGATGGSVASTHAMIVDSEGNQISITKTATDILTVYATLYVVVPDSYMNASVARGTDASKDMFVSWLLNAGTPSGSICLLDYHADRALTALKYNNGTVSFSPTTRDTTNHTITFGPYRFEVNAGNGFIQCIAAGQYANDTSYTELFVADLPNTSIWPGHTETDLAIGTGDGVTTDFDILCPIITAGSDMVKVGGVTKTRNTDYTIEPEACYMAISGLCLSRGKDHTSSNYPTVNSSPKDWTYSERTPAATQYIGNWAAVDLGEAKLVGGVRFHTWTNASGSLEIYWSDDGTDWTLLETLNYSGLSNFGWSGVLQLTNPATHRYWKAVGGSLSNVEFLSGKKALHFNTAPASGDAITISYTSPYIKKNTNYVLDISFQLEIGRYENE